MANLLKTKTFKEFSLLLSRASLPWVPSVLLLTSSSSVKKYGRSFNAHLCLLVSFWSADCTPHNFLGETSKTQLNLIKVSLLHILLLLLLEISLCFPVEAVFHPRARDKKTLITVIMIAILSNCKLSRKKIWGFKGIWTRASAFVLHTLPTFIRISIAHIIFSKREQFTVWINDLHQIEPEMYFFFFYCPWHFTR